MKQFESHKPPIIITGALFNRHHAEALWPMMQEHTPRLCQWLAESHARVSKLDEINNRCAAQEQFILNELGFIPQTGQSLSTGMALILALESALWQQLPAEKPFWIVELVHMAPGREGASLIPGRLLSIESEVAQALFHSVQPLLADTNFRLQPLTSTHWILQTTEQMPLNPVTTELVFQTTVQDWWDTSVQGRLWRQWSNEVQMLWFEHPVNLQRQEKGQLPINALWLMGGAAPQQLQRPQAKWAKIIYDLEGPYREQDWSAWLAALIQLEDKVLAAAPTQLIFAGTQGYLQTWQKQHSRWWHRLFTRPQTGQTCWLNPF